MGVLKIERLGGLGGFGLLGSRVRSQGTRPLSDLSPADQAAVESMFQDKSKKASAPPVPDGFRYRITRETKDGQETIEVPEANVPAALQACVKDELL
jgi:hypothetical protein